MKIGLIGLPKSGKTTIFNALSKSNAEVARTQPARRNPTWQSSMSVMSG